MRIVYNLFIVIGLNCAATFPQVFGAELNQDQSLAGTESGRIVPKSDATNKELPDVKVQALRDKCLGKPCPERDEADLKIGRVMSRVKKESDYLTVEKKVSDHQLRKDVGSPEWIKELGKIQEEYQAMIFNRALAIAPELSKEIEARRTYQKELMQLIVTESKTPELRQKYLKAAVSVEK